MAPGDNLMLAIKILGAIAAVVVIAAVAAGALMYFRVIPIPGPILALLIGAKSPEYSARYYPPDTLAYAWVTLAPGGGQLGDMQDIWGRLNEYPTFADAIDELREDFEEETGINSETEVMPWLGPEIGAAVIELDVTDSGLAFDDGIEAWDGVSLGVTIGVRDREAAAVFLAKWLVYVSIESDADFAAGSHRDFDTWVDESAYQAYALTDDWMVFATNEKTLKSVLERIDGDGGDSLADDANFKAAQAVLPGRRFASFYVDYQQGLELVDDFAAGFSTLGPGIPGPTAFANQAPDWIAGSTSWVERGIVTETVSPATDGFGLEVAELKDPAELLPDDTLGFMAGSFDPNVDHWRVALAEYRLTDVLPYPGMIDEINAGLAELTGDGSTLTDNATLADALDLAFDLVKQNTGIDLEADLFDHLAGQGIVAVRDFDFDAVGEDPTANAIDAVAMLSYREDGKDGLDDTMAQVSDLLENNIGMEANPVDVGADDDATIFGFGFLGMMIGENIGYQPGYVLHDQYLTIGTTENALKAIVARQNGEGESLSSNAEYRRAIDHLDGDRQFLVYVDTNRIIKQIDAEDIDLEPGEYRILEEGIGAVAFGVASDDDYSRGVAVLTLFPE